LRSHWYSPVLIMKFLSRYTKKTLTRWFVILCILLCGTWVAVCYLHHQTHTWDERSVLSHISQTSEMIDKELDTLKVNAQSLGKMMPHENDSDFCMKRITDTFHSFMLQHPEVESVMLGLQTELCDTMGEYFPMCCRRSGKIEDVQLPAGKHQLIQHYESDWYASTLTTRKARLSKPHKMDGMGQVCSYCIPLKRADGSIYAVLAVNYPIQKIEDLMKGILHDEGARIMLTMQDHVIMASTTDTNLGETLYSLMEKEAWNFDIEEFDRLNWKQPGILSYQIDEKQHYLYYRRNEASDWIILMDAAF